MPYASILCSKLCARSPYAANSLTYPFRQRATGLPGLMDITDRTSPRWKDKCCTAESSRGGGLWEKSSQSYFFFFPSGKNLIWLRIVELSFDQWACLWFTTVSELLIPLLAILWPLTLGLTHPCGSAARQEQNKCVWFILLLLRQLFHAFDLRIASKCVFCHCQELILRSASVVSYIRET